MFVKTERSLTTEFVITEFYYESFFLKFSFDVIFQAPKKPQEKKKMKRTFSIGDV